MPGVVGFPPRPDRAPWTQRGDSRDTGDIAVPAPSSGTAIVSQASCTVGGDDPWPEMSADGVVGIIEVAHRVKLSSQSNRVVIWT